MILRTELRSSSSQQVYIFAKPSRIFWTFFKFCLCAPWPVPLAPVPIAPSYFQIDRALGLTRPNFLLPIDPALLSWDLDPLSFPSFSYFSSLCFHVLHIAPLCTQTHTCKFCIWENRILYLIQASVAWYSHFSSIHVSVHGMISFSLQNSTV